MSQQCTERKVFHKKTGGFSFGNLSGVRGRRALCPPGGKATGHPGLPRGPSAPCLSDLSLMGTLLPTPHQEPPLRPHF